MLRHHVSPHTVWSASTVAGGASPQPPPSPCTLLEGEPTPTSPSVAGPTAPETYETAGTWSNASAPSPLATSAVAYELWHNASSRYFYTRAGLDRVKQSLDAAAIWGNDAMSANLLAAQRMVDEALLAWRADGASPSSATCWNWATHRARRMRV